MHVDLTAGDGNFVYRFGIKKMCAYSTGARQKSVEPIKCNWEAETQRFVHSNVFTPTKSAKREAMHVDLTAGSEKLFIALASAGAGSRCPARREGDVGIL